MNKTIRLLAALSALGLTCMANAISSFNVSVDTSSLIGDPLASAPYYIDFQLNDGGTTPGNNAVSISNVMFGGGSVAASLPELFGGASGDLASGVQIMDTDFFNEFYQEFIPGSFLSFMVTLTNNANNPGDASDLFSFSIFDSFLGFPAPIPTESFSYALLEVNIDGSPLAIETFAGIDEYDGVSAPSTNPVPDGAASGIGFLSIVGMIALRRRTAQHA